MREKIAKLALKIAALLSSLTIVIAVEPYIKLKGNFEIEFGRPGVEQVKVVQSLHNYELEPPVLEVR